MQGRSGPKCLWIQRLAVEAEAGRLDPGNAWNNHDRLEDVAVFKWMGGHKRIAGDYLLLSNLRLNALTCTRGHVFYSSSAPIVYNVHGRPVISFRDRDLMTIVSGSNRMGINVPANMLKPGEEAAQTRFCEWREVDEDHCPKWLEQRIMSMATGTIYDAYQMRLPDLYRISKKPETLKPIFSSALIKAIGGQTGDSTEVLLQKFHDNLDLFGKFYNDGYIIPNDYICAGGCCVVAARGIPAVSGSIVFTMPLRTFAAEVSRNHWQIKTALEAENEMG